MNTVKENMVLKSTVYVQLKALLPLLLVIYSPTLFALFALVAVNLQTDIPVGYFTRDPAAIMNVPAYIGLFSNLGILLWCSTAAICLFSAELLRKQSDKREWTWFILASGLITTMLLVDDLFLLHEKVFPNHMHIPQRWVLAGYGLVTLFYLARFRSTFLKTEFILLGFAFAFFGLSVIIDCIIDVIQIPDFRIKLIVIDFYGRHILEDGCKLLGIVSWATYFIRICLYQIRPL